MKLIQRVVMGLMLAVSFVLASLAQENNPYDGNWLAKFNGERGTPEDAKLVVKASAGTWTNSKRISSNPCLGRTTPVVVSRASSSEFEFAVNGSKVLTGCPDFIVSVKRVDDRTLEGQYSDGRKISLVRE